MGRQRCEKIHILRAKVSWWLIAIDKAVEIVEKLQMGGFKCETCYFIFLYFIYRVHISEGLSMPLCLS